MCVTVAVQAARRTSLYSAAFSALAVRFAVGCRPPHAFGVLRIHGYRWIARPVL